MVNNGFEVVKYKFRDFMEGYIMIKFIKNFCKDENGVVIVDWVVLIVVVVGLVVVVYFIIEI